MSVITIEHSRLAYFADIVIFGSAAVALKAFLMLYLFFFSYVAVPV
jgi:hypothetical protein